MSESKATKPGKRRAEKSGGFSAGALGSATRARSVLASAIWLAAVLCALILAVGALMIALDMNRQNSLVDMVLDLASTIDFGVFKDFEPDAPKNPTKAQLADAQQSAQTKSVMVNWGLAALIYLVVGKVVDRFVRPRS